MSHSAKMKGEKRKLVVEDRVDPSSLEAGARVEAYDADIAHRYWPARVVTIDQTATDPGEWEVEVQFLSCPEEPPARRLAKDLRPVGWGDQQRLVPQGPRPRGRRADEAQSQAHHSDTGHSDSSGEQRETG